MPCYVLAREGDDVDDVQDGGVGDDEAPEGLDPTASGVHSTALRGAAWVAGTVAIVVVAPIVVALPVARAVASPVGAECRT